MSSILFGLILVIIVISAFLGLWIFKLIFFILLIGIVIVLIIPPSGGWKKTTVHVENSSNEDSINEIVVLSQIYKTVKSSRWRGGKVTIILAGGRLDLRDAIGMTKEINLELVVGLGQLTLIIPKSWKINSQEIVVLGAFNNRSTDENADTILNIRGSVVLGRIDIINSPIIVKDY